MGVCVAGERAGGWSERVCAWPESERVAGARRREERSSREGQWRGERGEERSVAESEARADLRRARRVLRFDRY